MFYNGAPAGQAHIYSWHHSVACSVSGSGAFYNSLPKHSCYRIDCRKESRVYAGILHSTIHKLWCIGLDIILEWMSSCSLIWEKSEMSYFTSTNAKRERQNHGQPIREWHWCFQLSCLSRSPFPPQESWLPDSWDPDGIIVTWVDSLQWGEGGRWYHPYCCVLMEEAMIFLHSSALLGDVKTWDGGKRGNGEIFFPWGLLTNILNMF